jgi:hypothetical protein
MHESAVHSLSSSQSSGCPPTQAPCALHASVTVQRLPSSQAVPDETGAWVQAPDTLQASDVHGLSSSQSTLAPRQTPAVQTSP